MDEAEEKRVLDKLHSQRFMDKSPGEVYATLLDEGTYLCSELKYRPDFPDRFGSLMDARAFSVPFFDWYNREHRHSAIGMITPEMVHYGLAEQVRAERQRVLEAAYAAHPERFVRGRPTPPTLPEAVWSNPPAVSHVEPPRAENNGSELAGAVSNEMLDSAGEEAAD